ncbi:hypothetical protein [Haloplanus pelagicus]|jgi:hypothetical protein|uniref:hypothetical protein n=1 Tax=Haloplanus pelagicus TaxID=2949995 RepID=UPI00203CD6F3|nr:hypothetical protein [Haloplanus sp. HW8-1]
MTRTKLVAIAFAALVVTVGTVAATPGNAPVDVGTDDQYDDQAEATGDDAEAPADAGNESAEPTDVPPANAGNGSAAEAVSDADRRGPPADLPAAVPDHVSAVHDLIRSFLGGDLDGSPGDAVSDATPDDGDADAA